MSAKAETPTETLKQAIARHQHIAQMAKSLTNLQERELIWKQLFDIEHYIGCLAIIEATQTNKPL